MAVINDLIERISDPELRRRISEEVARLQKQKKFGLVFEEHLPEATPLYDIPIKKKSLVSLKDRYFKDSYMVKDIDGDKLICEKQDDSRTQGLGPPPQRDSETLHVQLRNEPRISCCHEIPFRLHKRVFLCHKSL